MAKAVKVVGNSGLGFRAVKGLLKLYAPLGGATHRRCIGKGSADGKNKNPESPDGVGPGTQDAKPPAFRRPFPQRE